MTPAARPRLLPARLKPGDRVCVVAPAGRPDRAMLEAGIAALEERGLRVQPGVHVMDSYGHLAGTDQDRAADLMAAFLDPQVRGIFCARGGVGCARMLPYLDLAAMAAHPKVFVGYSDVTIIHLALARAAGWPTFYGPMVATEMGRDRAVPDDLWRLISHPEPAGLLDTDAINAPTRALVSGVAEGLLTGGTLCLVETSLATSYAVDARDRLLALEDIHERPWRVDRMLTHLRHAGVLKDAAGFLIGRLTDVEDPDEMELGVDQSLLDHLTDLGKPILVGFPFGHIPSPLTLPFNCRVRMDAGAGTVTVLEAAVCEEG